MAADPAIPRLMLPMNFGLEKLYQQFNNNVFFVLQNGRKMGAAALMLGIHSPVLDQQYIQPGMKEIDVQDFAAESVVIFVEAMYNGIFEVTIEKFRDLYKLCSVFKVSWMVTRCIQFYHDSIDNAESGSMSFLFDEAMWACEKMKSDVLFDIWTWREALGAKEDPRDNCNTNIKRYIEGNYDEISEYTLKKLISVTDDHVVFVDLIFRRVQMENVKLDRTSRFLLLNIDLSVCMESCTDEVTKIFDVLLQDGSSPDLIVIRKLQRQTSAYIQMLKRERASFSSLVSQESPTAPKLLRELHKVVWGKTTEITLEHLADVLCNLYSVIEYMDLKGYQVTDSVLEKLRELKRDKGWNHVHPVFVAGLRMNFSDSSKLQLINCANITSHTHSVRALSEEVTLVTTKPTTWNFLTTSVVYKFKIQGPGQSEAENEPEYGFLVEKTGVNSSSGFVIKLIVDQVRYPEGLIYNGISPDTIHIALETRARNEDAAWEIIYISWSGKPVLRDDGSVMWLCLKKSFTAEKQGDTVRLVAYYSVEGDNCRRRSILHS